MIIEAAILVAVVSLCAVVVGLIWHKITLQRAEVLDALQEANAALRAAREPFENTSTSDHFDEDGNSGRYWIRTRDAFGARDSQDGTRSARP